MMGYRDGAAAYQVKQALSSAESDVSSARGERDRIDEKIRAFQADLRKPDVSAADKANAQKRIDELQPDLRRARDRIRDAESARDRAGYNLDRAHRDIGMQWGAW